MENLEKRKFYSTIALSSAKDDWTTPPELFEMLNKEFEFTVDLCADENNHLCDRYYTKQNDGLKADISNSVVFCNPPYGRQNTYKFVKKCSEISGGVAVMLLPARTDVKWFHDFVYGKAEIRFLKGRLKFGGSINPAPFPSMIVIFRGKENGKE